MKTRIGRTSLIDVSEAADHRAYVSLGDLGGHPARMPFPLRETRANRPQVPLPGGSALGSQG
jgi:hypothetical protein